MLRPERKERLHSFHFKDNFFTIFFLIILFLIGLLISLELKTVGAVSYLLCWCISYLVLFAGTCRNCVYYGKKCPIPLEGSCVGYFFKKTENNKFGFVALVWATVAYIFRIFIPVYIIINYRMLAIGGFYFFILTIFWIVHLRFTGCPNCINYQCPLNPEQEIQYE